MFDYLRGGVRTASYPDSPLLYDGKDDDKDGVADNEEEARQDPTKMLGCSRALSNSTNAASLGSDRFALQVFDAASRINVNACDNLCRGTKALAEFA